MADTDVIRIKHSVSGGVIECTRFQYEQVYRQNGWTEVAPDTLLTDQRYKPEGGGELQPPPTPVPPDHELQPASSPEQPEQ